MNCKLKLTQQKSKKAFTLIESLISKKIEELDLKDKVAQYDEPKKIVHKKKAKKKAKKNEDGNDVF